VNRVFCAVLVSAAVSSVASAAVFQARLDTISPERHMSVSRDSGASFSTLYSGVNNFTVLGGDPTELAPAFRAFCIDLNQTISFGSSYTFTTSPVEAAPVPGAAMGLAKADLLRELWGRHFASIDTNVEGSAFQIAVWEIVFDTGLDFGSGVVQVTGDPAVLSTAQGYLASLDGNTFAFAPVYALISDSTQDMLVPAPGALSLMGLGGLLVSRRRR
jgi:hypothetical protein